MKRFNGIALTTFLFAASVASAQQPPAAGGGGGQRGGGPPPMSNLQIIPKDTPREEVIATMQGFTQSLGVQCNYCHVQEGRGGRNDFATDEKAPKKTARSMMVFTRDIRAKLPEVVGKSADATTRVGCATCHRGVPVPKQITDIMTDAAATGGAAAGLAKFKELRAQFYGGQSYDFSEGAMIAMAQRANTANKYDDALAYLQANLEYYPNNAQTKAVLQQLKG